MHSLVSQETHVHAFDCDTGSTSVICEKSACKQSDICISKIFKYLLKTYIRYSILIKSK